MGSVNHSQATEFILVGLSSDPTLQIPLYIFFSIIYTVTVTGNLLLILAVTIDNGLQNPMYLFLSNLSFLDIGSTSTTVPNMLVNVLTGNKRISFIDCLTQVYFFIFLIEVEYVLLAFMAYDRYVAICIPLRYNTIMKTISCMRMISASWLTGWIVSSVDTYVLYHLQYCDSNIIDNFYCEASLLVLLSCSDPFLTTIVTYVGGIVVIFVPIAFILYSYIHVILAVFRIQSRRYKAFSTCVSHLIVVILFYGSSIFLYMMSQQKKNLADKLFSVLYSVITQMLNPLIYSLRNKDVQQALKNVGNFLNFSKTSTFPKEKLNK